MAIEYRWASRTPQRLPSLAADLVSQQVATTFKIPTIYPNRFLSAAGGLMSYGAEDPTAFRRLGKDYVATILKGAKPADIPVQLPTRFAFTINLKTANALNLTVPTTLLANADEVIE